MHAGVGYGDDPNTRSAGRMAATTALEQSAGRGPCDMVLLFATSRHDPRGLREAVAGVVGRNVPIYGGASVGGISRDSFGYAGDQVILAALWLEGAGCEVLVEPGLDQDEREAGRRLGQRMAQLGVTSQSPVLLFYDAIDRSRGDMRLVMATYLLAGLEESLGFLPDVVGAGFQGDYLCSATWQWTGQDVVQHSIVALVFTGGIRIDSAVMHGCRPSSGYYTVTRADAQVILEIDGQPAIPFINHLLGKGVAEDDYPFFLTFGVNQGERWAEYRESNYASRLCLGLDKERNGLVMFEPDMVEGTEFQLMYRTMELDYMAPKIQKIFQRLQDRDPVLALYINCAGRAAGYGGLDIEDAVMVQASVADQAPLLGIYTGVEIASVMGKPRGLDLTGVFCVFSQPREALP